MRESLILDLHTRDLEEAQDQLLEAEVAAVQEVAAQEAVQADLISQAQAVEVLADLTSQAQVAQEAVDHIDLVEVVQEAAVDQVDLQADHREVVNKTKLN